MKISILTSRIPEAVKALEKLNKKATRYGCASIEYSFSSSYSQQRSTPEGRTYKVQVVDIEFYNIEAPKVGDFKFLAELEVTPNGTIITAINDEELPSRFRTASDECEHCNTKRRRKYLYVVKSNKNEFYQVGKTCLRDFLGTDTPISVIARFKYLKSLVDFETNFSDFQEPYAPLSIVLAYTSRAIKNDGWVSCSYSNEVGIQSTSASVERVTFSRKPTSSERDQTLIKSTDDSDYAAAEAALKWLNSTEAGQSQYIHNLRVICQSEVITIRHLNIVCSLIASHQRIVQNKIVEEKKPESNHIGEPKERLKNIKVSCEYTRHIDGRYGIVQLCKLTDVNGNKFCWFNSSRFNMSAGKSYLIDGTVNSHSEYKGVKETQLKRITVKESLTIDN